MCEKIRKSALFSDETADYRSPVEPEKGETVTIRFRTAAGEGCRVYLVLRGEEEEYELELHRGEIFDVYETTLSLSEEPVFYCFRLEKGTELLWYSRIGASETADWDCAFRITPGFHTPDWAKGAIMYQIFTDRFCNGDLENDVRDGEYLYVNGQPVSHVDDWSQYPSALDVNNFYGGDLAGVLSKLDYLKHLGVEVLYFNPLFVSPSNHKYDSQDYDYIDPHFGTIVRDEVCPVGVGQSNRAARGYIARVTDKENLEASNELFCRVVEEAHKRGMRVILDGVFNHCGSFHKWLDREQIYEGQEGYEKGAYVAEDSPYHKFFKFHGGQWPYNSHYDGWWGFDTLPKLNYEESEELYEYIMRIGRKWVSPPFNADGWRLDVAADLGRSEAFNHQFWRDFRKNVKEAKPDALILAEHYGDPGAWLQGDQWDTVMNYDAFMEPLTWFLTGMEKHSDERKDSLYGDGNRFFSTMLREMSRFQTPSLQVAMNELSNHDHSRFLTRTNRTVGRTGSLGARAAEEGIKKSVLRIAVLVQMTWPGAPTIYYGDEAGVCGWTDPDCRRTYPWGHEDLELIEFHKYMTRIHKRNQALRTGSLKPLLADDGIIAYGRFQGDNRLVTAVNISEEEREADLPVWEIGVSMNGTMRRIMQTADDSYNSGQLPVSVEEGLLHIVLPPESSVLFVEEVSLDKDEED